MAHLLVEGNIQEAVKQGHVNSATDRKKNTFERAWANLLAWCPFRWRAVDVEWGGSQSPRWRHGKLFLHLSTSNKVFKRAVRSHLFLFLVVGSSSDFQEETKPKSKEKCCTTTLNGSRLVLPDWFQNIGSR